MLLQNVDCCPETILHAAPKYNAVKKLFAKAISHLVDFLRNAEWYRFGYLKQEALWLLLDGGREYAGQKLAAL